MTEKELEIFTKPNPEAYKRFKKNRWKRYLKRSINFFKRIWNRVSSAILWICAVGGFLLSLIQFFQNQN